MTWLVGRRPGRPRFEPWFWAAAVPVCPYAL